MERVDFRLDWQSLHPDFGLLHKAMGFPDGALPAPFDAYLLEAIRFAEKLDEFRGSYLLVTPEKPVIKGEWTTVESQRFQFGRTITKELEGSSQLLFFVVTAGPSLSREASVALSQEEPVKGYLFDQLGTVVCEAIAEAMSQSVRAQLPPTVGMTNRYSPGYCQWKLAGQQAIFGLFGDPPAGVSLSPSFLMNPIKSVSGVIGLGEVRYRDYPCDLCNSPHCIYRRILSTP
ncbi:MAG: hypothetical protein LWW85_10980 [Marinilabiliales bacterium]|nr:hypothetical protein [Marinilabiliales bacterium]